MTNLETYKNCFVEGLELELENVEDAKAESLERWDSIGQMSLVALIEDAFEIEFEPDELMSFNSYTSGLEILKNHGVEF